VRLPPRWRIAASILPLAVASLLGAVMPSASASSTVTVTDQTGDTKSDSGAPFSQPRADIIELGADYKTDGITVKVKTADPQNPKKDPNWADSTTGLGIAIDTTGDFKPDYVIEYGIDAGNLYGDVYLPGDYGNAAAKPVCTGQPSFANGYYTVVADRNCLGSPDRFYFQATMLYTNNPQDPNSPQGIDSAPDAAPGWAGPVDFPTDPGTTPDPGTNPGGGGTNPGGGGTNPGGGGTTPVPPGQGYWLVAKDGGIFSYGNASFKGSTGNIALNQPIVGMTARPDGSGYWFVAADGGIFAFGDVGFYGSTGAIKLNRPIVGMAATPTGKGYWLVANDGGIFAFGDAGFYGSTGAIKLNRPIVGMAPTPSGRGYWLVANDGGIFAFGDAGFFGSTGSLKLNRPIVSMAATPSGKGYWFVANDGGIFAFGDAKFYGSGASINGAPVVGIAATKAGDGYRLVRTDGSVGFYGAAMNKGSMAGKPLAQPIVGIAS
jgi:ribosomal protein L24E